MCEGNCVFATPKSPKLQFHVPGLVVEKFTRLLMQGAIGEKLMFGTNGKLKSVTGNNTESE